MRMAPYPVVARGGWAPEGNLKPAHLLRQVAVEAPTPQVLSNSVGRAMRGDCSRMSGGGRRRGKSEEEA
jgi:hypothetical protein